MDLLVMTRANSIDFLVKTWHKARYLEDFKAIFAPS